MSRKLLVLALLLVTVATAAFAQRRGGRDGVRRPGPDSFNGTFTFCRLAFRGGYGGYGGGWAVDYPRADQNLTIRLSELTKAPVNFDEDAIPHYVVILATDEALFQCPFVMLTNPGGAFFTEDEVAALRTYLQKGGFLWSDDSWGSRAWEHWLGQLREVLPAAQYPLVDLPSSHPMFRTLFEATRIPQIPNIGFYRGTGGTSERGADSTQPHAWAILDAKGQVMVLNTHNTDFGDAYEREADDPEFFYKFSVEGYAIGIDILLYAMTH